MNQKKACCLLGALAMLFIAGCCCIKKPDGPGGKGWGWKGTNGSPGYEHETPIQWENPGAGPCGTFCNFYVFNNDGQGYLSSDTSYSLYLTYGASGPIIPNTDYHLFHWRPPNITNCAANGPNGRKTFTSSANKRYVFTVYLKPGKCTNYMDEDIYLIPEP